MKTHSPSIGRVHILNGMTHCIHDNKMYLQVGDFKVFPVLFLCRSQFSVSKLQGIVYTHPDEKS
jgi:hypothetical protein